MNFLVGLIALLLASEVNIGKASSEEDQDEYPDSKIRNLSLFDSKYIEDFESQIKDFSVYEQQRMISKLGKIAFFIRLYRSWIHSPNSGRRGFEKFFPEPSVRFHAWIYDDCSTSLIKCVNKIYKRIQERAPLLFPRKGQHIKNFALNSDVFMRMVSNGLFSYDVSISYLMCFLTKNHLSLLARLPFCSYGVAESQNKLWPSSRFRDYESQERDVEDEDQELGFEPIDDLINQTDFQCADESFCPDPCCGRLTGRSSSSDGSSEVFCSNSICLENSLHQTDSDQAAKKFINSQEDRSKQPTHSCYVDRFFNDQLGSMMGNKWNLSCTCLDESGIPDATRIYRSDVRKCVDIDECLFTECGEFEKCINTVGSYQCVCRLGYIRKAEGAGGSSNCIPINFKRSDLWHGATESIKK